MKYKREFTSRRLQLFGEYCNILQTLRTIKLYKMF